VIRNIDNDAKIESNVDFNALKISDNALSSDKIISNDECINTSSTSSSTSIDNNINNNTKNNNNNNNSEKQQQPSSTSTTTSSKSEPWNKCLQKFWSLDKAYCDSRLKMIPSVVEGNWAIKMAVGHKPAITGTRLEQQYFRGKNYFEIDINIASSPVANRILAMVFFLIIFLKLIVMLLFLLMLLFIIIVYLFFIIIYFVILLLLFAIIFNYILIKKLI
jgi:hypothetical protein